MIYETKFPELYPCTFPLGSARDGITPRPPRWFTGCGYDYKVHMF